MNHITFGLEVFNPRFKGNTVTDRDSSLKHISATLARRPNKCITLSRAKLSNTGNSPRDSDIPIIKLTPGSHIGSPCNFKRLYMRVQRVKGGRGAGFGVGGDTCLLNIRLLRPSPLPLGISNDLPKGECGYFLEPHKVDESTCHLGELL